MADYLARKTQFGLSFKTDWGANGDIGGTITATPSYTLLAEPSGLKSTPAITREEMQLTSSAGLVAEKERSFTDSTSGIHRLGFTAPAFRDSLPLFLFLSLFKVTETDLTTPNPDNYQHVFVPFADTGIPDFTTPYKPSDSAPQVNPPLCSLFVEWLTGSTQGMQYLNDCILNSLNLTLNVNNQGIARFLNISGEFVAGSITENANSGDSTFPAAHSLTTFNNATAFTFSLAGTVSYTGCFKTWGLSINNNVTSDCRTTGGRVNNYRISPEYMVDFTIPCNDTTDILVSGLLAGTEQTITLSTGTTQTLGYLNIVAKGALTGNLERVIENNVWVYKGQLKCEKSSGNNSLVVTTCSLTHLIQGA